MDRQIFIGSSLEGRLIAEKAAAIISRKGLTPLPWYDFFQSDQPPLEELDMISSKVSGAVLVASADDRTEIRQRQHSQMRDNVLFEYGLFSGKLGRNKCALLVPDLPQFRIPSDFLGLPCYMAYNSDNVHAICNQACEELATSLARPRAQSDASVIRQRALALYSWIVRPLQDYSNWITCDEDRKLWMYRILGVRPFITELIDELGLQAEFEAVESSILRLLGFFPDDIMDRISTTVRNRVDWTPRERQELQIELRPIDVHKLIDIAADRAQSGDIGETPSWFENTRVTENRDWYAGAVQGILCSAGEHEEKYRQLHSRVAGLESAFHREFTESTLNIILEHLSDSSAAAWRAANEFGTKLFSSVVAPLNTS